MNKINTDRAALKKFGLTMAVCFGVIALVVFLRNKHSAVPSALIAVFFLLAGLIVPVSLKYVYIVWMKLAFILGWFNTRLILCVIFYLIFFPVGLIMRLFRIDVLERKCDRSGGSYWKAKEKKSHSLADYERQF